MTFSQDDLDHIIHLAHLDVEPALRERFLPQIQSILGHMESINQFNLDDIAPAATALQMAMPLRDDEIVTQPDLLLSTNAPQWVNHAFVVPKILSD
ncbi:Asp-tRNA(Asn)/Glu-tRNA(Gln) amidotransferase GatCAB subunit C [bacterium]|nr:Asp-tRNA(Asn)/Glu-tRNA(Gln) amidotransferase GatCAB subunit C [bacterium]